MPKWFVGCIFCFSAAMTSFSAASGNGDVMRLGLITPPPHQWTKTATAIAAELEKDGFSKKLSVFPSGQLGNEAQMLQLLQTGAMDIGFFTTSELANRLPQFAAFYTPYLAKDAAHAARILSGTVAVEILASTRKIGLVGLGYGMAGMRQIVARGQVSGYGDLKGLKVRVVPDAPLTDFWYLAGTAPTAIPLSVLYDAFANGQVDAMHIDFENTLRLKFYQHAKSVLYTDHMMFPMVALASAKSWARMSEDDKKYLNNVFQKHLAVLLTSYVTADQGFKEKLIEEGVNIVKVDKDFFGDAPDNWYDRWSKRSPYVQKLKEEADSVR
ncbi:TRAP transporter substrate-binding protein [Kordiimonas pumila]|uniref:TRAP transporter substrate-binding protein n=1 Tax=Kordiimonas pumila TaxID=2161677 RepID=A0ABV7D9E8_9PROT|nr:TRAP transporter substrate-binding protein [Kordiimonas pumila]